MMKSKKSSPTQNKPHFAKASRGKDCVVAIDPGFDRIGVAVLIKENSKEKLLYSTCIVTNRNETKAERLGMIGKEIKKIIKRWNPEYLAIEKLFFNQNTTSVIGVAEARGVILYEAALAGLEIFEYGPQEIKIATTGYGKATKKQVADMVQKILNLKSMPLLDDEIDAIAVGITHLASVGYKKRLSP